jgi:hypothetical protein
MSEGPGDGDIETSRMRKLARCGETERDNLVPASGLPSAPEPALAPCAAPRTTRLRSLELLRYLYRGGSDEIAAMASYFGGFPC